MSSIAENKMYPTIRMSKTKKRVTAATKLQALVRGKLARRTATAKKQQKQVKGRSAYKSYLSWRRTVLGHKVIAPHEGKIRDHH